MSTHRDIIGNFSGYLKEAGEAKKEVNEMFIDLKGRIRAVKRKAKKYHSSIEELTSSSKQKYVDQFNEKHSGSFDKLAKADKMAQDLSQTSGANPDKVNEHSQSAGLFKKEYQDLEATIKKINSLSSTKKFRAV